MDYAFILNEFSVRFVRKALRERVVHEALKKPRKLQARVCHEISDVFDEKYKGGAPRIGDDDRCLFLGWSGEIVELTWREARERMASGGGGYLVINSTGTAFYAETEGYPAVVYAGHT